MEAPESQLRLLRIPLKPGKKPGKAAVEIRRLRAVQVDAMVTNQQEDEGTVV